MHLSFQRVNNKQLLLCLEYNVIYLLTYRLIVKRSINLIPFLLFLYFVVDTRTISCLLSAALLKTARDLMKVVQTSINFFYRLNV